MRTTLNIDDEVLAAAKALAARERKSVGGVISALARQAPMTSPTGLPVRNARACADRAPPHRERRRRNLSSHRATTCDASRIAA